MPFTKRIRIVEFAGQIGATPAQVLGACRKLRIPVAAPESVLDPRECELLARELGPARRGPAATSGVSRPARVVSSAGASRPQNRQDDAAWAKLEKRFAAGESVSGRVTGVVKGGITVDVGVRAFVPASLVDIERVENLEALVGRTIEARVIECDRAKSNVVLSRKVVLEAERARRAEELRSSLAPGQRREATIRQTKHNGVVVDLGGITAWVPLVELALSEGSRVADQFSVGDPVVVTVCDVCGDDLVVTFRTEATEEEDDRVAKFLDALQSQNRGGLFAADGVVCLDVTSKAWPDAFPVICQAVEELRSHDLSDLMVRLSTSARQEIRQCLRTNGLPGVDTRSSRQRPDGFMLKLAMTGERS